MPETGVFLLGCLIDEPTLVGVAFVQLQREGLRLKEAFHLLVHLCQVGLLLWRNGCNKGRGS
jgi:hypothetical protein